MSSGRGSQLFEVMTKNLRLRTALIAVGVIVLGCVAVSLVRTFVQDRLIPGGIVAYRSYNLEGMKYTHCACGHKGYFIVTDQLLLWYVTDHETLQPHGEIVSSVSNKITVERMRSFDPDEEKPERFVIEIGENKLHIAEPPSEYSSDSEYSLKKTYLGPDIRALVESFDYEEWKNSREDQRE